MTSLQNIQGILNETYWMLRVQGRDILSGSVEQDKLITTKLDPRLLDQDEELFEVPSKAPDYTPGKGGM